MSVLVPERIGPYEVVRVLGKGGMGVVYEVRAPGLAEPVALKQLLSNDPTLLERFRREGRAMQLLSEHPNIVRLHGTGEADGRPYIVMELCPGGALSDRYRGKVLQGREAADVLLPVARAMHFTHELGIIHRDLKPQNVLYDGQGRAKVTDLGIAKSQREESMTASGAVFGTPTFMAPEQADGHGVVDRRVDIWALGVMLFHLVSGRTPFEGEAMGIVRQLRIDDAPLLRSVYPKASRDVEAVCAKALRRDPRERYPTAEAFAQDLERLARGDPPVWAEPGGRFAGALWRGVSAAALVASVAAIVVVARSRGDQREDTEGLHARISALEAEAGPKNSRNARAALAVLAGVALGADAERELASAKTPVERAKALVATAWRIPRASPAERDRAARIVEAAWDIDETALLVDLDRAHQHHAGTILIDAASPVLLAKGEAKEPDAAAVALARRRIVRGRVLAPRERSTLVEARALEKLSESRRGDVQHAARPWLDFSIWSAGALRTIFETSDKDLHVHGDKGPAVIEDLVKGLHRESPADAQRKRAVLMDALLAAPECAMLWIHIHRDAIAAGDFPFAYRCANEAGLMANLPLFEERVGDALLCLGRDAEGVKALENAHKAEAQPFRALLLIQGYMRLGRIDEAKALHHIVVSSYDERLIEINRKLDQRMDRMRKE